MTGRGLAGNIRRRFRRGSPKSVLGSVRRPGNESGSRDTQQTRFGRSHHGIGPVRRLEFWIGVCRLGHGVFRSVSFLCQSPFVWRNRGQIAAERGLGLNSTLLIANVINLGADLGSMGAVSQMLTGGLRWPYVVAFGLICIAMQVLLEYTRYVKVLKWLTLSLLAYFGSSSASGSTPGRVWRSATSLPWPSCSRLERRFMHRAIPTLIVHRRRLRRCDQLLENYRS